MMPTVMSTLDQDSIVCEVEIAAPVARVFQALTDAAQVHEWSRSDDYDLVVWELDPRPGGKWRSATRMKAGVSGQPPALFEHWGEVLEIEPPRLLVYTWFAAWHEHPATPSTVRWELTATPAGTRLKLTHSGLAGEPKARDAYSGGWPGVLDKVREYFEG